MRGRTVSRRVLLAGVLLIVAGAGGLFLWWRYRAEPRPEAASTVPARATYRPAAWPPDPGAVPGMLRDTSWRVRLSAANALRELPAIGERRRVELLLDALDREAAAPDSGPPLVGSYVPLTTFLRLQYVGLLDEVGPGAADAVRDANPSQTPAGREWRAVAAGATGAPGAAAGLRPLVRGSSDFAVRMMAAHYLGHLKDRDAVPLLRAALEDPARTRVTGSAPGRTPATFYPVRQTAAAALRELGLSVEKRGEGYLVK